jgi:predicted DNA-binding transcriptional regulator AlpA
MELTAMTQTVVPQIPPALAGVALIDATTCAAAGAMSLSWWHQEVRAERAPQPAVRKSRCTRWRVSDVAAFWQAFALQGQANSVTAEELKAKAKHASIKAREPAAVAKAQATRKARIAARHGVAA